MIYTVLVDGVEAYSVEGLSRLFVVVDELGGLSKSVTVEPQLPPNARGKAHKRLPLGYEALIRKVVTAA